MKDSERKIERAIPKNDLPVYLRQLADALERNSAHLPAELIDLPATISRLKLKAKARDGHWDLKLKIKTRLPVEATASIPPGAASTGTHQPSPSDQEISYKALKKRMKTSFKALGAALAAGSLPAQDLLNGFLAEAELMMRFEGANYGETYYPVFRAACRELTKAMAAGNLDRFKTSYAALSRLKNDCHKNLK